MNILHVDSQQSEEDIRNEIAELEQHLQAARSRLKLSLSHGDASDTGNGSTGVEASVLLPTTVIAPSSLDSLRAITKSVSPLHFLLLLSDSALPLGSFAFSSGLESYQAHTRPKSSFPQFLSLSLDSYARASLPFVLAAYRCPADLSYLDDALDATIMCTVGRRASIAQGRALLSIWERSFSAAIPVVDVDVDANADGGPDSIRQAGLKNIKAFSVLLRAAAVAGTPEPRNTELPPVFAHLAPLFGVICATVGLTCEQTAYVFTLSHVKALLSAAVRAGMFGPYHAQKLLASSEVQVKIDQVISQRWDTPIEDAGQSIPVLDLWIGRHEMLYSRIFNS